MTTIRRSTPALPHDARTIIIVEDRVATPEARTTVDVFARGSASTLAAPPQGPRTRMLKGTPPPEINRIPSLVSDEAKTTVAIEPRTSVRSVPRMPVTVSPVPTMPDSPTTVIVAPAVRGSSPMVRAEDVKTTVIAHERGPISVQRAPVQAGTEARPTNVQKPAQQAKAPQNDGGAQQAKAAQPDGGALRARPVPTQPQAKPAQQQAKAPNGASQAAQNGAKPTQANGPQNPQAKPAPQQAKAPNGAPVAAKPAQATQAAQASQAQLAAQAAQVAKPAQVARGSAAPAAMQQPVQVEPAVPTAAIPVGAPIEVPNELFGLIRRIALQADLTNAAGVLHSGLGELLQARVVMALVGEGGAITSPIANDLRTALEVVRLDAIGTCAERRQVLASERCVLVPFATTTPAVLIVWRAPSAPVLDHASIMLAVAAATRLGVVDHFMGKHAEQQRQAAADAKSMFRAEALSASRQKNREGAIVDLSGKWTKIALPAVVGIAALLIAAAALVKVPTYSRGAAVVTMNGKNVIANMPGRISAVFVTPGQIVKKGDALIELDTMQEHATFDRVDGMYRDQLAAFLADTTDDNARHSLSSLATERAAAQAQIAQKTITAPADGTVGSILANDIVQAGEQVMTIIPPDSEPSVTAFMPGSDLSRIQPGMTLQVAMSGYAQDRQHLVITDVGTELIGPAQARKQLGQKLADAVALPQTIVVVKAKLVGGTFEASGKTYNYFDGMDGLGEIEVDTKSFLSTILPTGD